MKVPSVVLMAVLLCWSSLSFGLPPRLATTASSTEKRDGGAPAHWTEIATAMGDTPINLLIALKQSNLYCAEEYMRQVSHPKSHDFGRFWTPQKVVDAFAPSRLAVSEMMQWLHEVGVVAARIIPSAGRNWIRVNSTVAEAETLLGTTYNIHRDGEVDEDDEGSMIIACEAYSLPASIRQYIDFASPTIQFDTRTAVISRRVSKRDALAPKFRSVNTKPKPQALGTRSCLPAM